VPYERISSYYPETPHLRPPPDSTTFIHFAFQSNAGSLSALEASPENEQIVFWITDPHRIHTQSPDTQLVAFNFLTAVGKNCPPIVARYEAARVLMIANHS
jgi:hypothetical protein